MIKTGRELFAAIDQRATTRRRFNGRLDYDERRELATLLERFAGDMNVWVLRYESADVADDSEQPPRG